MGHFAVIFMSEDIELVILLALNDTNGLFIAIFLPLFDILKRANKAQYYIRGRDGRKERCLF